MRMMIRCWLTVLAIGLVSTPAFADPAQGERVFQRCFSCHSVVAGDDKLPGPNLKTVIGRRAGTLSRLCRRSQSLICRSSPLFFHT